MNVLILMAGDGKRFVDEGINTPKPLVEVNGKTILEWTTRSIPFIDHYKENPDGLPSNRLHFAIREEHEEHGISDKLKTIYGDDINIITFKKLTNGNLETAYMCALLMDEEEPLLVLDSDNKYNDNNILETFVESLDFDHSMVVSYFDPIDDSSKWAFIYTDGAVVKKIVEKDPKALERGGLPLVGTFWFKTNRLFLDLSEYIISNGFKVGTPGKEEFYMTQVPSLHAANGGAVFAHKVDDVVPLGTPADVEKFRV